MRSRRLLVALVFLGLVVAESSAARADYYVEYYRDNLFLGIAYHRVGCLTDWSTIQSNQDYDGFTSTRYCDAGATSQSVPGASWFDYQYLSADLGSASSRLDACGVTTNGHYRTPEYAARSTSCSYNIVTNCNSDCWIRYFSTCVGHTVSTASPCWGYAYP
jgi:hypothetical protein